MVPEGIDRLPSAEREQLAGYAAMALGGMLHYTTRSHRMRLAILQKAIEVLSAVPGSPVTVAALYQLVESRDDALLTAVLGDFDDRQYRQLAQDLLALRISKRRLLEGEGERLDIDGLLGEGGSAAVGQTRLTVISRPGALVLHGGGGITEATFDRFIALAGGKRAHIVLVPSAGYRPSSYDNNEQFLAIMRSRFSSWVHLGSVGQVASFQFLYTDDLNDADDDRFVRPLATATGVWFSGGDQTRLNYRFVGRFPRQTKFQVALHGVLERGGVVGGTSAGMAALPEIMTLTQHQRRTAGPLNAVAAHGLGLLSSAIVEQHFDGRNGRLERFTDLLRDSPRLDKLSGRAGAGARMLGLAVEEGTALVVQEDRLEVLGRGAAHVLLKSPDDIRIVWHTLRSGSKAALKRDGHGDVTLARKGSSH